MIAFILSPSRGVHYRTNRSVLKCTATSSSSSSTDKETFSENVSARGENARRLAKWIAAEWSNKEQAIENPPMWAHIHVCFRPLEWKFLNGYSFYTESGYDYDLSMPYKTSIIHLIESPYDKNIIEWASYKIKNAEEYWLGCYEPDLLKNLKSTDLIQLNDNCNTMFKYFIEKNFYVGKSRPGKLCKIKRRADPDLIEKFQNNIPLDIDEKDGKINTYLDSTITLSEQSYTAWDIGKHLKTDERVWGPAGGAFRFFPVQRFDHLVPEEID